MALHMSLLAAQATGIYHLLLRSMMHDLLGMAIQQQVHTYLTAVHIQMTWSS
jgi:hypothetical protein